MLWFVLAVVAGILYTSLIAPRAAMVAWIFSYLLLEHFRYVIPGLPLLTFTILSVPALFAIHFFSGRFQRGAAQLDRRLVFPLLLFLMVQVLALLRTEKALTQVIQVFLSREILPVLVFFLMATLPWEKEDLKRTAWTIATALALGSAMAVYEHFTQIPLFFSFDDQKLAEFPFRPTGPFTTAANLNAMLALGTLAFLPRLIHAGSRFGRGLGWALMALMSYAGFLANYRGTLLPLAVLVIYFFMREPARRTRTVLLVLVGIALATITWTQVRQSEIYERRLAESGSSRVATYLHCFKVIAREPVFGHGFENTVSAMSTLSPTYFKGAMTRYTPHDSYLMFLIESGLVGFGLVMAWFYQLFRRARGAIPALAQGVDRETSIVAVLACLLYLGLNLTQTSYTGTINIFFYFIVAQLLAVAQCLAVSSGKSVSPT